MVLCLERDADLHMAQLMPLPLTVSCFSKIQIGVTFLVPAHPGSPGQSAVKRVCVYINRNANKRETDANTIRCSKTWSSKLTLLATNWRMRSCPMSDLSPCLYQSRRSHSASSCYNSINMGSSSSTSASAAITAVVTMSYQPTLV